MKIIKRVKMKSRTSPAKGARHGARSKAGRKATALLLCVMMLATMFAVPVCVSAKTISSAKADNIFFYATDSQGKSVLLKVMPLSDIKELAHGQSDGSNYYISTTDNYPTTQYCESRGITIPEMVDYVKSVTTVKGASSLNFSGSDTMYFMATDSYGNYSRSWTYDELYGVKRYYFEGLYDSETGWNSGWEVGDEDDSKYGMTLDEYNKTYKSGDKYYANKAAVFKTGVETEVVLATESYSGRTTTETLIASTEPGIASYIRSNGGVVAGCLKDVLSDAYALRLSLPMTEADLYAAHRTAYDNFKWIYNMKLDSTTSSSITSQGTVAEPVPTFSLSGDKLTITFSCATSGATIYYGYDGAPQTEYTGSITVDVSGRDLDSDPVTIYATAVKEGYDDAGVLTFKYPGMAPSFQTVYSSMTGSDLVFTAATGVSSSDWTAWTKAISFITMKSPSSTGYATLDKSKYTINNTAKTITFDKSLFTETGSYSFVFHATKYANKNVSVTMKKGAPSITAASEYAFGNAITLTFDDSGYNSGLSVYVTPEGGSRTMISTTYLDRSQEGQVTILASYFTAASSVMTGAGKYTLELSNNNYSPASQTVDIVVTGSSGSSYYKDVPTTSWYYTYVTELTEAGVINGMGNNMFEPKGTLTWGQALKLLMLTAGYSEQASTGSGWASGYIDKALADGIITERVSANDKITRLEFCQAAARAMKLDTTQQTGTSPYSDTTDASVLALTDAGVINGNPDGTFLPNSTLIRSEISKIIWCIRNLEAEE